MPPEPVITEGEGESSGESTQAASLTRDEELARDRAAFLADDDADVEDDASSKASSKTTTSTDDDDDDEDDDLDDDDDDVEEDDVLVDDDDEDEDEDDDHGEDQDDDDEDDEDEDGKVDAATSKRLDKVRRTDKRLRERREADFRAREATIQRTVDEWKPRIEKSERNEKLIARLTNPFEVGDVLRELGMKEDDFEAASQTVFAQSKKFADDPKARAAIAQHKRDRELHEEIARLKAKDEARETADREAKEQAAQAESAMRFMRKIEKATDAEQYPLAAKQLAKNPKRFRERVAEVAVKLWDKTGEQPSIARVLRRYEKRQRAELADLGLDVSATAKTETQASKTTSKNGAVKTKPKTEPKTGEKTTAKTSNGAVEIPTRDEILRELEDLDRKRELVS